MQNIQQKIDDLVTALRSHSTKTQITFNLFINSDEVEITERHRTIKDLNNAGVSMRNLKGEFIK